MQEADTARRGDESGQDQAAPEASLKAGEDMSDKDVAKLIVVKQSRQRSGGTRSQEDAADAARLFSEGLKIYEQELREVCFSPKR